ncbi:hypothetical protein K8354_07920 [Polaribacter litorisediminis]|uniref:hypothetical protein n=1 Tax=Polaribacter litorisediminis TaxID=1908341 RepID=UPI001CBC4697|nr:hypothetical protein [Polaribacter litorisediminis]UAM99721.1 hypothetical protein K8354_07920 [Polaribacter litorisediminis]
MLHKAHFIKYNKFLKNLHYDEFVFQPDVHISLAATIVKANLLYKPGVYIVYDFSKDTLGNLLYVGKAGANKEGVINAHQIPKRLLAVCYPPEKYLCYMPSKNTSRNEAWPIMMQLDKISKILICCFYSKITSKLKITADTNPLFLEKKIIETYYKKNIKQQWAKRK